jgi:hypothetical protein
MTTKSPAFIAVVTYTNGSTAAVQFATMTDLYAWEDAHPEVEVISSMPLVSRNLAEQASA